MKKTFLRIPGVLAFCVLLFQLGNASESIAGLPYARQGSTGPQLCTAIRGNGEFILTHFTSLARLIENLGPIDGAAGGSSASLTIFLYESMRLNPVLNQCGSEACSFEAYSQRLALLLKSMQGYVEYLRLTPEGQFLEGAFPLLMQAKDQGVGSIDAHQRDAFVAQLLAVVNNKEKAVGLPALLNRELLSSGNFGNDLAFQKQEIQKAAMTFGSFSVDDNMLFFRPGLIDFKALSEKFARIANFYSVRGSFSSTVSNLLNENWRAYLDACSEPSRGITFESFSDGCKKQLNSLISLFRNNYIPGEKEFGASPTNRLNESVGGTLPALVTTSVLYNADQLFDQGQATYRTSKPAIGTDVDFHPEFGQIRFGYWGRKSDLAKVESQLPVLFPGDLKSEKFLAIPSDRDPSVGTWRAALQASPAEPGLSRMQKITDGKISAGGWSDLHPVQVLRAMGCEKIVYVTRRGEESPFALKIAQKLGMTQADEEKLYDLNVASSSLNSALKEADAVWCTNWNDFSDAELFLMAKESYYADFFVNQDKEKADPFFGEARLLKGLSSQSPYPSGQRKIQDNSGCLARY